MKRINVVVLMAGRGHRFRAAGYQLPKPMVDVAGKPMLEWAMKPFEALRFDHRFIFVALESDLDEGLGKMISGRGEIVALPSLLEGAVQSALAASNLFDSEDPLLIANCDQFIDWDLNEWIESSRGYEAAVLAFRATNPHHSYISTSGSEVCEVREKEVISDLAVAGLYFYASGKLFLKGASMLISSGQRVNGEFYISPIFNEMLSLGYRVTFAEIPREKCHMLGTPEEVHEFEEIRGSRA